MNVTALCFHSEGKWLATGSEDGTIKIWDMRWAKCLALDLSLIVVQVSIPATHLR